MDHQYFNPGKKQYSKFHEMNYSTLTAHRREIDLPILSNNLYFLLSFRHEIYSLFPDLRFLRSYSE